MTSPAPRRPPIASLALLTGVAGVLRFSWLTAERLWYDEVFSAFVAAHHIPELMRLAIDDQTNPPAFYVLLWAWARLGSFDDAWLRALPAILGTLTPAVAAVAGRAAGLSWRTALLGGVLVAGSPLLLAMSVEVRAYSAVALLATAALAITARLARDGHAPDSPEGGDAASPDARAVRDRQSAVATLTVLNLALASLHVFGLVAVLSNTVAGIVGGPLHRPRTMLRRARPIVLAAVPAVVLLAAWLVLVQALAPDGRFAGNAAWVRPPTLGSINGYVANTVGHFGSAGIAWAMTAVLLFVIAVALARPASRESVDARGARLLVTAALLPPLAVVALYLVTSRSLWLPRYFVATVPPIALLIAVAVHRVRAPWRAGVVTLVAGWILLSGVHSVRYRAQKPDWAAVLHKLSEGGRPTTLCVLEGYVVLPLRHYAVQEGLTVSVMDAGQCAPGQTHSWAVYRPQFESTMRQELAGAQLGPEVEVTAGLTPTVARRVSWPEP